MPTRATHTPISSNAPSIPARAASLMLFMLAAAPTIAQDTIAQDTVDQRTADAERNTTVDLSTPIEHSWTIRLEPFAGYIGPAGDLRMPSSTTAGAEIELSDLNLDSPRLIPMGRVQIARDRWRFVFSGLAFSADDRGSVDATGTQIGPVAFTPGDRRISDLAYESFELQAAYRLWTHTAPTNATGNTPLIAGVDLLGGIRLHHADISIRNEPAGAPPAITSVDIDEFFAEPIVGAKLDLTFNEKFGIEVESAAGGFGFGDRTSYSVSIDAGFAYRPTPAVGVKVGYRMLLFGLTDGEDAGEFEWSGSMAGLYFGAQISF